jgi:hypothetical protein
MMTERQTKRDECECCRYETEVTNYGVGGLSDEERWYCELCSSTMASARMHYGSPDAEVLKTICYIGNVLRDEIRAKR